MTMSKVMPEVVRGQFEALGPRTENLLPEAHKKFRAQKSRFMLYLALLLGWFLGQPFADPVILHFFVQSLGLLLLALATGALRVMGYCNACIDRLERIEVAQTRLLDKYGVDLGMYLGNPIAKAKELSDPAVMSKLQQEVDGLSESLVALSARLRMSEISAYTEMFGFLRGRFESESGRRPDDV